MSRTLQPGKNLLTAFGGGMLATVPMTLWMLIANRSIPRKAPDRLPPEEITFNLAEKTEPTKSLPHHEKKKASLVNHFLYGGLIATPFILVAQGKPARAATAYGMVYGLLVWAGNYLGILPVLGLYPSATREPARMNGIMIAAHLVWGGSLGWLLGQNRLAHR
jgi:uncharacterized membrane protein YagU involved in acid resistance